MKFIESYIYLIITVVFLNLNSRKISKYYNIILHSIMFIPMCSVYGLMNNSRIFMFTVFICFILLFNITSLNIILPKLGKIKRKSVLFIFIIKAYHLYFFSSSESYEGMSQHLNIYFLSVFQFKYLRFYMYSKRHFRMRLLEVYF